MSERINDKINEIELTLEKVLGIIPTTLEEYKSNEIIKAACERFFEKIIESYVDLCFLIIKEKKLIIPEGDIEAFESLAEAGIISKELSEKLQEAKRMRNIIIHLYGEVDDEKVFYSLSEELEKDVKEFLKSIRRNVWILNKNASYF